MSAAAPGRVLRQAVIGWGLGDLALGRRGPAVVWMLAEVLSLGATIVLTVLLADTTWYLIPFLAGAGFVVAWAIQAVIAYRRAVARIAGVDGEERPTPRGSPAAVIAWLTIPLLAWGAGFWLVAGASGSPDAVLDRFVTAWPQAGTPSSTVGPLGRDPALIESAATASLARLEELCAAGQLNEDCAQGPGNLLRDVRVRLDPRVGDRQRAVAEVVRYERVPSRFLGLFDASELRPVPLESLLELELAAEPGPLGSERWVIVNAEPL